MISQAQYEEVYKKAEAQETLENEIKIKDYLIQRYEDIIKDIGGKIELVKKDLPYFDEEYKYELVSTITFPKYQFACVCEADKILNKLYKK